jgi:hypothetical protein
MRKNNCQQTRTHKREKGKRPAVRGSQVHVKPVSGILPDGLERDPGSIATLQQSVGNRNLQLALVQLQNAPPQRFNPLDPTVIGSSVRAVVEANEAPVRDWLTANTNRLRLLTMGALVKQVRRNVPQASNLADVEIQNLAREWAAVHNITIPVIPVIAPTSSSIQIPDVVKKAFSIPIDGVDIVTLPGGRLNVSASGATAKLSRAGISYKWGGSLGIDIPIEGFQLAGKLDKDRWEITFSTPGASSMPDLSKLSDLFKKSETAMRGIVTAVAGLGKQDDISKITATIIPHISPVKEGVQALVDIAKASGVSADVSISGPVRSSEELGGQPTGSASGGISVNATITIRF